MSHDDGADDCPVRHTEFDETVCGVPTRFVLTAYTNRIFVIIAQAAGMGTLVRRPPHSARRAST